MIHIFIYFLGLINVIRLFILSALSFSYNRYLKLFKPKKAVSLKYKYRPLVSVLIAAFNEEVVIKRTLEYVFANTYKNFEVIVINDGSTDKTDKIVKKYIKNNPTKKLTYISQKNAGKAHALNNGIKNFAKGKLIMCLDADSILRNDAIRNAVVYFRDRRIKAIATNVKIIKDNSALNILQRIEYIIGYHLKKALTVGNIEYIVGGVGSTFRASILKRVGYYDTDTLTEDIDLTMKIVRLGNKKNRIVFASNVVASTESPLSFYALFRQRFRWKFGRFQTFWKNRALFFNKDKKYTKALTFGYLPFQVLSELLFLFDPLLFAYVLYVCATAVNFTTFYSVFLFIMFFTVIGISFDEEQGSVSEQLFLLAFSPIAYLIFFSVSAVEYFGLVKSIIKWKEIVYADRYNACSWVPVARLGKNV